MTDIRMVQTHYSGHVEELLLTCGEGGGGLRGQGRDCGGNCGGDDTYNYTRQ